jgi:phospholipid transport system substrate-binding protein
MLSRRLAMSMIAIVSCLGTLSTGAGSAWAQAGGEALALVKSTSDQLVAIVNGDGSARDKRLHLQEVIEASVDTEDIGRICLGRFWPMATPDQQSQYLGLFRELLVIKIADHLGEYRGVKVTMGAARRSANVYVVTTTVTRPENPSMQVEWVIATTTGRFKIVDLLAEGTSLRQTQSDDFSAYLARHHYKIQDLLNGMGLLVAQNQPQ